MIDCVYLFEWSLRMNESQSWGDWILDALWSLLLLLDRSENQTAEGTRRPCERKGRELQHDSEESSCSLQFPSQRVQLLHFLQNRLAIVIVSGFEPHKNSCAVSLCSVLTQFQNSTESDEIRLKGEIARREVRREKIRAAKARIEAEADVKNESVDPKKQKSFNDLDAQPVFSPSNGMSYSYNVGCAVDAASQIIVACDVHSNSNDVDALEPLVVQTIEYAQAIPEVCLADAGYNKAENFSLLEDLGVTPIIAMGRGEREGEQNATEKLTYDSSREKWLCPKGKIVVEHHFKKNRHIVEIPNGFCIGCKLQESCPLFAKQGRRMSLPPEKIRAAQIRNAERLRTTQGKALYKRRKAIVEAPFGNMKNEGMRILVKGRRKVATRVKLFAIAHNVEKIAAAVRRRTAA